MLKYIWCYFKQQSVPTQLNPQPMRKGTRADFRIRILFSQHVLNELMHYFSIGNITTYIDNTIRVWFSNSITLPPIEPLVTVTSVLLRSVYIPATLCIVINTTPISPFRNSNPSLTTMPTKVIYAQPSFNGFVKGMIGGYGYGRCSARYQLKFNKDYWKVYICRVWGCQIFVSHCCPVLYTLDFLFRYYYHGRYVSCICIMDKNMSLPVEQSIFHIEILVHQFIIGLEYFIYLYFQTLSRVRGLMWPGGSGATFSV